MNGEESIAYATKALKKAIILPLILFALMVLFGIMIGIAYQPYVPVAVTQLLVAGILLLVINKWKTPYRMLWLVFGVVAFFACTYICTLALIWISHQEPWQITVTLQEFLNK